MGRVSDAIKAPPNFISEIFYLSLAVNHTGQQKIVNNFEELARQYEDIRRHLEVLQGDQSWQGVCVHTTIYTIAKRDFVSSRLPSRLVPRQQSMLARYEVQLVLLVPSLTAAVGGARQDICSATRI